MKNIIPNDEKSIYKDMARRLRIERLMAGLTQEELSETIDVSPRHYGRYESGRYPIPFDKAGAFIRAGIDFYYVVTGERYLDRLFIDGLTKMPDEELLKLAKELPESSKTLNTMGESTSDYEEVLETTRSLILKIISYGRSHHDDPYVSDTSIDSLLDFHAEEIESALAGNKQYEQLKKNISRISASHK